MKADYLVHEEMYQNAREMGWNGWGGNERLKKADLVDRYFELEGAPAKGTLLEIGCGEGHHCRLFAERGFEVTGIDISQTAIKWAREKAATTSIQGTFLTEDVTSVSLKPAERYDVVIDGNCFHCIIGDDRFQFLRFVNASLKPSGVFFLSSLCSKSTESIVRDRNGVPFRHISSERDLECELSQSGFRVINKIVFEREEFNHVTVHASLA
jgi:2-polyprenyl-3-methyl-5-hydroxy-6-metoxy-1,4-benzoquinol methylase